MDENTTLRKITKLTAPTYQNTTRITQVGGVNFTLWDVMKAALAARLNVGLYGGAGMGKSQLLADVQGLFGNNASYVLGRNDLDIKSLFRQLNFQALVEAKEQGGTVSQAELTNVTSDIHRPLVVVEEINRAAEVVQNQLFNVFEGFIELDGKKYALGGSEVKIFRDLGGEQWEQNMRYSVGVWSANFGNGQYTGTVSMDKALKERSHLIVDVDNFAVTAADLDAILLGSAGEVRLKEQQDPQDHTSSFANAFAYMKQQALTPDPIELGQELLLFRYLVHGLDYVPCEAADNSKRAMKEVWPAKVEEDQLGNNEGEKKLYSMVFPSSVRGAMSIIGFARSLREYARARDSQSKPDVLESVIESFKLIGAYSGMIENPHRVREQYVGNPYRAACDIGSVLSNRLQGKRDMMDAVIHLKTEGKPLPRQLREECKGEYACFK